MAILTGDDPIHLKVTGADSDSTVRSIEMTDGPPLQSMEQYS